MAQVRWPVIVPLGQLSVTGGTPLSLATNCGPLAGQTPGPNYLDPPIPGTPLRQIILTNTAASGGGNIYLLPRGSSFGSNPGNVMACVLPGQTVAIPYGMPFENGILPENLVLDSDSGKSPVAYGTGIIS